MQLPAYYIPLFLFFFPPLVRYVLLFSSFPSNPCFRPLIHYPFLASQLQRCTPPWVKTPLTPEQPAIHFAKITYCVRTKATMMCTLPAE